MTLNYAIAEVLAIKKRLDTLHTLTVKYPLDNRNENEVLKHDIKAAYVLLASFLEGYK